MLQQRTDVVSELEKQLSEKQEFEFTAQTQLERLKMELSGFLKSPPASSPEPQLEMSFTFEDLMQEIMDLKDELQSKFKSAETERTQLLRNLQDELDQHRKSEERVRSDREFLQKQMESNVRDKTLLFWFFDFLKKRNIQ